MNNKIWEISFNGLPFQDVVLTAQLHIHPETSLERLVPLVEIWQRGNFCQYISLGPADYRNGYQYSTGLTRPGLWGVFYRGGPPAGSGKSSVRERGHICTSLQQGNRGLQPVFHSSKEGWGDVSHFRSSSSEWLRHAAQVQNVNFETNRATDQIQGLVCHDRSLGHILPLIYPPCHRKFLRFAFGGKAYQYWVLSFGLAYHPALSRNE